MNRRELIEKVFNDSRNPDLTRKTIDEVLGGVLEAITAALMEGEAVVLADFGRFSTTTCPDRTRRNPKTNENVEVPAHRKPCFRAGKGLKLRVKPPLAV